MSTYEFSDVELMMIDSIAQTIVDDPSSFMGLLIDRQREALEIFVIKLQEAMKKNGRSKGSIWVTEESTGNGMRLVTFITDNKFVSCKIDDSYNTGFEFIVTKLLTGRESSIIEVCLSDDKQVKVMLEISL